MSEKNTEIPTTISEYLKLFEEAEIKPNDTIQYVRVDSNDYFAGMPRGLYVISECKNTDLYVITYEYDVFSVSGFTFVVDEDEELNINVRFCPRGNEPEIDYLIPVEVLIDCSRSREIELIHRTSR